MSDLLTPLRVFVVLWILAVYAVQGWATWRVEAAETYALRAARDFELARLIQRTRELNDAALAVLRAELENPCVARNSKLENRKSAIGNRQSAVIDRRYSRPWAPLPAIPLKRDQPQRARHQSD